MCVVTWILRIERAACEVLDNACLPAKDKFAQLLPLVATVVPFMFFHRAGTSARLLKHDLWVDPAAGAIYLRERHAKGKARNKTMRLIAIPVAGVPTAARLLDRFKKLHALFGHRDALWLGANEAPPQDASALMTAYLGAALAHIGVQRGAAASHAARHGAATRVLASPGDPRGRPG